MKRKNKKENSNIFFLLLKKKNISDALLWRMKCKINEWGKKKYIRNKRVKRTSLMRPGPCTIHPSSSHSP